MVFICAWYSFTIGLLLSFDGLISMDSRNLKAEYDSNNVQQKQKIVGRLLVGRRPFWSLHSKSMMTEYKTSPLFTDY